MNLWFIPALVLFSFIVVGAALGLNIVRDTRRRRRRSKSSISNLMNEARVRARVERRNRNRRRNGRKGGRRASDFPGGGGEPKLQR